jgi:glutamate synthase (NADPH) small chain
VTPKIPAKRTGKKVAIVGSGPAGLACADQLNQAGHNVTVFEREDRIGGLLMYGIPNMKLDKEEVVQRRVNLMTEEGIVFKTGISIGKDAEWTAEKLRKDFDAVVLCCGATLGRDLPIENRDAKGVYLAMEFLTDNTRYQLDHQFDGTIPGLNAKGKDVVVIGGGDTGTDCVGTSLRHGCKSVIQLEIMPMPPMERAPNNPWPEWPKVYKMDYGQEEAAAVQGQDPRQYLVQTKRFLKDDAGNLSGLEICDIEWVSDQGRFIPKEKEGSARIIPAQLALLAMGFLGPESDRHPTIRPRNRRPLQREGRARHIHHQCPGRLRRRRHAPWPVAGRLGHQRRPRGRPRVRPLPDGRDPPALIRRTPESHCHMASRPRCGSTRSPAAPVS